MRINVKPAYPTEPLVTHEGAPAKRIPVEAQLRRSVMSCMLWEKEFYKDGQIIADRISELTTQVAQRDPSVLAGIAIEARHEQNLRHVPLLLLRTLVKVASGSLLKSDHTGTLVADAIERVISRADELSEFVAIYRADATNKKMLPAQMKKGLARAFQKFDEYALAKYDREGAFRLRDVLFLCHARPRDEEQAALWKRLINGEMKTPDTWEVALSAGADKRETFERLLREKQIGYFALLRNLRNMAEANVEEQLVRAAILARQGGADKILPFRYVAAARAAPRFEPELDTALCESVASSVPLSGKTIVLVDVSGSMDAHLSGKSDMKRIDAAAALASVVSGDLRVFTFSNQLVEVPPRRGMAGVDAVIKSQDHGGTRLGQAVQLLNEQVKADRLVVITDEQSHDSVPAPKFKFKFKYLINVASNKNGIGYGSWTHMDGWSDSVLKFIPACEAAD